MAGSLLYRLTQIAAKLGVVATIGADPQECWSRTPQSPFEGRGEIVEAGELTHGDGMGCG
jgi:hypothetical protein